MISDQLCNSPLATSSPHHPVAKLTKNSNTTTNGVEENRGTTDSQSKYSKKDKQIPRKPYKPMKALVINFQSIRNKKAELATCLEVDDPDVLIGTETWLDDSINSCEIFPSNYSVFRKDRQTNAKGTAHGGVLIAVKSIFVCTQMHELDSENESVWIEMEVNGTKPILVGSFYRPPSTSKEYLNSLKDSLGKVNINHYSKIWLGGDFNLGDIIWESHSVRAGGQKAALCKDLIDIANDFCLEQVVEGSTRGKNILDLFFVKNPSLIVKSSIIPGISDHDGIPQLLVDTKPTLAKQNRGKFTCIRKQFRRTQI